MKKRSVAILGILLTVLLLALSPALAIGGPNESDMEQARAVAQGEIAGAVDDFPEWQGAKATDGQPYYNLQGDVICYWFSVSKEGKVLGNVVVGSWLYDHVVFKLGTERLPSIPTADELSSYLKRDLALEITGKDIGEPLYMVYATYSFYFAIYELDGQKIGIDLIQRKAMPASDLQMGIASPEQYRQHVEERSVKPDWKESLPLPPSPPDLNLGIAPPGQLGLDKGEETKLLSTGQSINLSVPSYVMWDPALYDDHENNDNCGPTSGSMIVVYHKDEHDYEDFDDWVECHSDPATGEGGLYDTMKCNDPFWGVSPGDAGPGWIEYAEDCGYYDFVTRDENSDPDFYPYEEIKSYIDIESPIMIMFQVGSPYGGLNPHWCALKGYEYDSTDYICINDPRWLGGQRVNWELNYYKSWLTYIRPLVTSYDIDLYEEWNMVSLPLVPDDTDIEDVLADVLDNVSVVQYYDAESEEWLWYAPGNPASTLTTMEDGKGCWIYMDSPDTLTVEGTDTASLGQPPEYEVFEDDWNMIGFTSPVDIYHGRYLDTISGEYSIIWGWDAEAGDWINVYPMEEHDGRMEPGLGYYVYMYHYNDTIVPPWG